MIQLTNEEETLVVELMNEVMDAKCEDAEYAEDPDDCTIGDEMEAKAEFGFSVDEIVATTIAELVKKGYINAKH